MLNDLRTAVFWISLFVGYAIMNQVGSVQAEGPEKSKAGKKGQAILTLKAAIIREDGDIVPAVRALFTISNYNVSKIRKDIEQRNNAGPSPDFHDPKYQKKKCLPSGYCFDTTDTDLYNSDRQAWEAKAHVGLDAAIIRAGGVTKPVTTDLTGEASLSLPMGTWYISGSYSFMEGRSNIFWHDVEVDVNVAKKKVELSNDNGQVYNIHY